MSVARFVADQRTMHRVPHAVTCAILGVSVSWFYKWLLRAAPSGIAAPALDARVQALRCVQGHLRLAPDPRDLLEAGGTVSVNTVASSMQRQGLQGRKPKRRRGLTRQDKSAPKFPDLLNWDFTAPAPNLKWCGDITEIPTDEGKLFASVLDLFSRSCLPARPRSTRTPSWRATRSRWPRRCAAGALLSTG